jgi:hypothetical protein
MTEQFGQALLSQRYVDDEFKPLIAPPTCSSSSILAAEADDESVRFNIILFSMLLTKSEDSVAQHSPRNCSSTENEKNDDGSSRYSPPHQQQQILLAYCSSARSITHRFVPVKFETRQTVPRSVKIKLRCSLIVVQQQQQRRPLEKSPSAANYNNKTGSSSWLLDC